MRNPIENLGDYNRVREDLQAVGGNIQTLYKTVGDTAVSKATPMLLLKGGVVGVGLVSSMLLIGYKSIRFMKERKQKIENEPALKKEFVEMLEAESAKLDNEEYIDYDTTK